MIIRIKSLRLRNTIIMISIMLPLIALFLAYDVDRQTKSMRKSLTDRGIYNAWNGSEITSKILTDAIRNGALTEEQVFDTNYQPIPNTDPQKYHTVYDSYTDLNLIVLEDSFLKDEVILYAVALDVNGYLPTHNSRYSVPGGGLLFDRSKRIFDDPVGKAAAQNLEPYLFQVYRRDTGEITWDISAPIFVNGRHWGVFRVGVSIDETEILIAAIRNQIIGGGTALTAALLILVLYITNLFIKPVKRVEDGMKRIAQGDLTACEICWIETPEDEIGKLIRSYCDMVDKLRHLAENTDRSVEHITSYTHELQDSIQKAVRTTTDTAVKMSNLAEIMKIMEKGAREVAETSGRAVESLSKAEKGSMKIMKQMETSGVEMTRTTESVKELKYHIDKVSSVLQFIPMIADQANLLAQKAMKEIPAFAERTDFSVLVADIQKRAQDAAEATRNISSQFERAHEHIKDASIALEKDERAVEEGYKAAREATQLLGTVISDLQNLTKLVKEVTAFTKQVSDSVTSVNAAAEEQKALVKGFTAAAETLDEVVKEMRETLMSLKF